MFRMFVFVTAFMTTAVTVSQADASCSQVPEISAARTRWAVVRQRSANAARTAESCRLYSTTFLDAVNTRQAISLCEDPAGRQQNLELIDADIDALNNLLAAQCSGS